MFPARSSGGQVSSGSERGRSSTGANGATSITKDHMSLRFSARVALISVLCCCATFASLIVFNASPAMAGVEPYGYDNYGDFNDILPPGADGLDNLTQALSFESLGQRPANSDSQLAMYSNLTTAAPNIQASQIGNFYKTSVFGVPSGDVAMTESPEPGVTIEWDNYGVPHIYGDTRAETEFGVGYATARDRLFFIDALRHAGEGDLASFAGGANVSMDESVWANEPYTPQDLQNQVNYVQNDLPGGNQVYTDATNYVAGINAYITAMENPLNTASMEPAEYRLLNITPQPWHVTDLVAIATLVGGIFGVGGGQQLQNAVLYEDLAKKFGGEQYNAVGSPTFLAHPKPIPKSGKHVDHSGFATFMSIDDPNDPEAPTTIRGKSFPYQTLPKPSKAVQSTVALPDYGSVQNFDHVTAGSVPASDAPAVNRRSNLATAMGLGLGLGPLADGGKGLLAFPSKMSNALLISAKDSADGHPLAVMGPQVAYYTPEILMEEDIHGPGLDAAGAAFPGVNLYVELGHGADYAWSATSADQNIVDTFAVPLCNPAGGAVSPQSDDYLLHGQCVAMETLTDSESWKPNLADSTAAGSVTFTTLRTAFGLVIARATIKGKPVVYTNQRSTYMHEIDSAVGFSDYNNPADMQEPADFYKSANTIGYTFNWLYINNQHDAYFNSGQEPVRAPHTDPLFPTFSSHEWKGWTGAAAVTPEDTTEQHVGELAHPHVADQSYITSWNNKEAPGVVSAATGQQFASIWRSDLLDINIRNSLKATHNKMSLVDLINDMGNAGTQDLRGVMVLPYLLKIVGHPKTPALATAVSELTAWMDSGAHRINREHPGATGEYDQGAAIQIMDAWWPLLIKAEFNPVLGAPLLGLEEADYPDNDEPGHGASGPHLGSAFDVGFYGLVQKDLRSVLKDPMRGALNRVFCGRGSLSACRTALTNSLAAAVAETPDQVYPADAECKAGDQMCSDSIMFRAIGTITQPLIEWVNRPTFQQADEISGHGYIPNPSP
jgi:acyl-homoserine lactone acylase PvdQ